MLRALRLNREADPATLAITVGVAVVSAVAGYVLVVRPTFVALMLLVPVALWLVSQRLYAITTLAVTLPYLLDVSGGLVGLNVAPSDIIMVFLIVGLLFEWVLAGAAPELRAVAPLKGVFGQYVAVLVVLLAAHPSLAGVVNTLQRVELFVFPVVIGALIVRMGRELWVLNWFVIGCTVTAGLWLAGVEFGNKNPMGQFMADAIIVLLAVRDVRRRLWWALPVLAAGTLWTQSRGAMVSVGVGFAAFLLVQPGARSRVRSFGLAIPLAAVSVAAFRLLPETAQQRNLTFTSADESAGAWAIRLRETYQADAWEIIHAHPWTGIGVGNYLSGSAYEGTLTNDPHQVLLQQGAEGGFGLMASYIVLIAGAVWVLWRRARSAPMTPLAIAMTVAIVGHGMVDVYWLRGGPVIGWLLVGMAIAGGRSALQPHQGTRETSRRSSAPTEALERSAV